VPRLRTSKLAHGRETVRLNILQSAITEAVRTFDSDCELFMGVFVEKTTAKSKTDANWTVKGIKYGKADREKCTKALATIVESMQREFNLSEGQ